MKLFYGRNAEAAPKGTKYRNPRFFAAPEEKVSLVYLGDYPAIQAAYERADVKVIRTDGVAPPAVAQEPPAVAPEPPIFIPADWRDLPWTQPADGRDLTLRGLAASITDEPIRSRPDAVRAIEAYLAGEQAKAEVAADPD